jgi:tetratricopeptide (TPR) repeat protein
MERLYSRRSSRVRFAIRLAPTLLCLGFVTSCAARTPADQAAFEARRLNREQSELYVLRGREAERGGDMAAAAEWWRQAALLDPEGKAETRIRRAAASIERYGDGAVEQNQYEDAFLCYGALLQIEPDLPQIIRKDDAAHAAFAAAHPVRARLPLLRRAAP